MVSVLWNSFLTNWYLFLAAAVIAYLLGSINPAVIVTRIVTKGKKDIRDMGSGNAGFTNVLRSVGKVPAVITIVCDALKCIAAVFIGYFLFAWFAVLPDRGEWFEHCYLVCVKFYSGVFCMIGHSFPIFFRFKGGKGIVTAAALILASDWRAFLLIFGTFLVVFIITRIISLASIVGSVLYAPHTFLITFVFDHLLTQPCLWYVIVTTTFSLFIGIFAVVKHKDNIKRLRNGEEKKIRAAKNEPEKST